MIEIKNLNLSFTKEYDALHNVNISVKDGEKIAVVGKADSGKTMLLRVLCKLENIKSGEVYIKNINLNKIDFKHDIAVGFVPKSFVFLNNKTVKENLDYVLKMRNLDNATINLKVLTALKIFNLKSLQNIKVKDLSKYQKTLLQLARVSMRKIELFLIDDICMGLSQTETDFVLQKFKDMIVDNPESTFVFAFSNENFAEALGLKVINLKDGCVVNNEDK